MDELFALHHDHVFLRRDALAFGYGDRDLRNALRAHHIVRVRHGAYTPASNWDIASEERRHQLRAHAVLRSHSVPLALSHTSAAVEHGLRLHKPDLSKVHVTCLDVPIGRTTHDVVYHELPTSDAGVELGADGIVMMNALRAALDTAAMSGVPSGVVVLDSLLDKDLASPDGVEAARGRYRGPGSRRLHVTVRLVRPGAESVGESLSRVLCFYQHLPEPLLQFEVYDEFGNLIGRTDFAWPAHGVLGEFDGRTKYGRLRREGETVEEAVVREKEREDRLREITGWLMIRLVWADLYRQHDTGRRIRHQLVRGRALLAA
jgi:hypothetical protein